MEESAGIMKTSRLPARIPQIYRYSYSKKDGSKTEKQRKETFRGLNLEEYTGEPGQDVAKLMQNLSKRAVALYGHRDDLALAMDEFALGSRASIFLDELRVSGLLKEINSEQTQA